jgi:cob(I)alamin adenosyltransferase
VNETKGLVYVFTGEGKGKTSAAIGGAVRAVGVGMRVVWIGFYKQASWKLSEVEPLKKLGVEVFLMGKGFHITNDKLQITNAKVKTAKVKTGQVVVDSASQEEHGRAAREALEKAKELLNNSKDKTPSNPPLVRGGKVDLVILDEVNNAVKDGLIDLIDLIDLISKRKQTHLILTGRDAHPELVKLADLVTEMKKVKHPYDEGRLAVRGLDF